MMAISHVWQQNSQMSSITVGRYRISWHGRLAYFALTEPPYTIYLTDNELKDMIPAQISPSVLIFRFPCHTEGVKMLEAIATYALKPLHTSDIYMKLLRLISTRWNGFVGCSSNIVMKQTPNHQVADSADCRVDAFEMNRTRRTKFMTNIWSANENNLISCVNLRNCYINCKNWAVHILYIHGVDVIN